MSYNREKLTQILKDMKQNYFSNPNKATKGQSFIKKLHEYCKYEFTQRGINESKVHLEKTVSGSHSEKDVDVVVMGPQNNRKTIATGPLITISIKSQMSSVKKNFQTVYDRIIGEVLNLHNRFPLLIANCLYLYPTHGYTKPSVTVAEGRRIKEAIENNQISNPFDYDIENINFEKFNKKYALITGRKDPSDFPDKHEHFALLVVDFDVDPPCIKNEFIYDQNLKIDDFFDKIYEEYLKRNASFL